MDAKAHPPEIHRIEGELWLRRGGRAANDAEGRFRMAIDVAPARAEKSLGLRAATSLARLWLRQGRHEDARGALAGVYEWFTEGSASADLRAARKLLSEVS